MRNAVWYLQISQKEVKRLRDREAQLMTDLNLAHREVGKLKVVMLDVSPEATV